MAKTVLDYTSTEINAQLGNATKVVVNKPLGGGEESLTALEVGGVNYKFPANGNLDFDVVYTLSFSITNASIVGETPKFILSGETINVTIAPNAGYILPDSVTVAGATGAWNKATGVLTISGANNNVTITIVAIRSYGINVTTSNITADASNPTSIVEGGTAVLKYTADGTTYETPQTAPTITGATSVYNRISATECTITLSNPNANISFTIEGELMVPMPTKGQLVYIDLNGASTNAITPARGYNNIYRVLKIEGKSICAMAMYDIVEGQWGPYSGSRPYNKYSGSTIDTYLNTTWYNSLSTQAKAAIVDKNLNQYEYTWSSSVKTTNHSSYADYSTKTLKQEVGNRHAYSIGIEDVEEYFGGTFTAENVQQFFYNSTTRPSDAYYIWTSSAEKNDSTDVYYFRFNYGDFYDTSISSSYYYRPIINLDMTKISWIDAGPYTITNNLTNCTKYTGDTTIMAGGTATVTYKESSGYQLPSSISVTGASYVWSKANKKVTLSNPTGAVTVTIVGETRTDPYPITNVSASNMTKDPSNPTEVPVGGSASLKFTANSGYILPFLNNISVYNASKAFDRTTGTLTISNPQSEVQVYMSAIAKFEETWQFHDSPSMLYTTSYDTDFISNGTHYYKMSFTENSISYDNTVVYSSGSWASLEYKTVVFQYSIASTSLEDAIMRYNATKIGPFVISCSRAQDPQTSRYGQDYEVYDGTDSSGTLCGTVSESNPNPSFAISSGHFYVKPVSSSAYFSRDYSSWSLDGFTNVSYSYESETPAYFKGDIDTTSSTSSRSLCLLFKNPSYSVSIYNNPGSSAGAMGPSLEIYDGTSGMGSYLGSLSSGMRSDFTVSSGHVFISCMDSYSYPYKESSTTGDVYEDSHTTSSATFTVTGMGSIDITFAKPDYTVSISNQGEADSLSVYDGMDSSGTYKGSVMNYSTNSFSFSSGNIYISWMPSYEYNSADYSGGVTGWGSMYSWSGSVTGDGSVSITTRSSGPINEEE